MKIKLLTIYAGAKGTLGIGSIIENFSDEEAEALVDGGYAELMEDDAKVTQEIKEPEKVENKPKKSKKDK